MDNVLFVGPLDRVLLLRTQPMLEGLGPIQLAAIAQHAKERHYSRSEIIVSATETSESVHLIVDGEVELTSEDGTTERVGIGDAVGFIEMLSRSERPFEARAIEDTFTLELDWDAQLDVCEEHFAVVMAYVRYLGRALMDAQLGRETDDTSPVAALVDLDFRDELDLIERITVLSLSQALSRGCLDALSELAHHVSELRWSPGDRIWAARDRADHFLLLASGSLECRVAGEHAFLRRAGSLVGLHEALCERERWHSAVCVESTTALRIDTEPFIDILEDHFDLAIELLASLAEDLIRIRRLGSTVDERKRG